MNQLKKFTYLSHGPLVLFGYKSSVFNRIQMHKKTILENIGLGHFFHDITQYFH